MNTKQKLQLHDRLYRRADKLIKRYNPCRIEGEECLRGRNPCCDECKYLGKKGCTVKSLMCKLHLCFKVRYLSPKLSRMLSRIENQAFGYNILLVRGSREDVAKQLKFLERKRGKKWNVIRKQFGILLKINRHLL